MFCPACGHTWEARTVRDPHTGVARPAQVDAGECPRCGSPHVVED